ncbi:MAG: S41 family peptidase, partial [Dehalococcoidia bacterium]
MSRKIPSERRSIAFAAVARMMSSLPDDHTNVYEPEEHPGFVAGLGLQPDIGIGVILAGTQPPYIVRSIVPGTPAANNRQIQEGDTLNFVGPTDVTQTTITREQLDKLLAGDEGSLVVVKVSRNGGPPTAVTLRRASYLAPVLTFRTTGPNNEVGVLTLREFPESYVTFCDGKLIEEELDAYLRGLPPAVKLLIFDLRGNRGGCTSSLAEVVARFVDGQVVVKSTSRGDDIRQTPVDGDFFKDRRVPLAVLIDENSASASELFAQAIKDWKRGIVVGRKSAGSVGTSRFYDIGDGAALQIKVADAVSGLGVILDGSKNGVMPDVTVEDADLGSPDYGGDRFITKAAQTAPARYAELVPPVPSFSCKLVRPSNEIRDDLQDLLATGPMIPEVENRRLGGEQVINTACEFVSGALDVGKAIRSLQRRGWR